MNRILVPNNNIRKQLNLPLQIVKPIMVCSSYATQTRKLLVRNIMFLSLFPPIFLYIGATCKHNCFQKSSFLLCPFLYLYVMTLYHTLYRFQISWFGYVPTLVFFSLKIIIWLTVWSFITKNN